MIKLVKLTRIFTYFLLIGTLLFVYATLPRQVGIMYDQPERVDLDKNDFFYVSLILTLSVNLMIALIVKLFGQLPASLGRTFYSSTHFKEMFLSWLAALAPVLNIYFICIIAFIGVFNNGDQELINSYEYLVYLGPILIFIWLISLILILVKKNY